MPFLTEAEPPRGVPLDVLPGIRRIVARNPSVMTYQGTNTYLIEGAEGLSVLDPGPDDSQHVQDILAVAGSVPVRRILLTHTHRDHFGAVAALRAATGAPVHAYRYSAKPGFTPDRPLGDGDDVAGLTAIFTPGHAADHLCFALRDGPRKILFSGDHVMSWSSSIVSPPDGDMLAYYRSLERLLDRDDELYLSGHGPALPEPQTLVRELLAHRQRREATILRQLDQQDWSVAALAERLYAKADPYLKVAAQRNVLAHLLKLTEEGRAAELEPATELPADAPQISALPGEVQHDALRRFGLVR
ncbi:MAG TPA: MBL fold metallo-hydrolase [Acidocella sp.]|jgi:glyoxylase-like metal-dependent hydrolase (beta-lactamase superfamily II)|uniref:MBL fold metallo-hydrolase n=1 Tax=Acidocella sp. TaxID=50710 RepID=UPI002CF56A6D|nr:MBL fold metallo-hydrolase [Acidocella sp.]HVE23507.1 MBL fold metallo-hydrolase [Acidocella sp.]